MPKNRLLRYSAAGALAVLVLIQFVRPPISNPPVKPGLSVADQFEVPPQVSSVFDRACKDCHSHRTVWPWYSHVAPMGWLVAKHVNEGRRKMNFDDWGPDLVPTDVCQEIRLGRMPMPSYLLLHPQAKLTGAEIQTLCSWSQRVSEH